jgi:NADP-dependent 3-hydroxy acid dehydrogenase YdfG
MWGSFCPQRAGVEWKMALPADTFANMVVFAMSQPDDMDINEILFRPVNQEL